MTLQERMLMEKERLENEIMILKERIHAAPEGTLVFLKNGSREKFYRQFPEVTDSGSPKRIYIGKKDAALLLDLAKKSIDKKSLQDTVRKLKAVNSFLSSSKITVDNRFEKLQKSRTFRDIIANETYTFSNDLQRWIESDFPKNPDHPENLIIPAAGNIMVRSKSEAFIAYALHDHGIPFRYECALELGKYLILYPDFTIKHPDTGKIIIWEHFGLMDDPVYARKAAYKVKTYMEHGFIPNQNLLMTFESAGTPFDFEKVLFIIEHMIL